MKIAPSLLSVLQTHSVDDLGTCMQVSCMALAHGHDPCLIWGNRRDRSTFLTPQSHRSN